MPAETAIAAGLALLLMMLCKNAIIVHIIFFTLFNQAHKIKKEYARTPPYSAQRKERNDVPQLQRFSNAFSFLPPDGQWHK
jgi:hypothetical protein